MKLAKAKTRSGLFAALDIGSTKACCFIGKQQDDGSVRVVGIGNLVSRGMKNGVVVDMEAAETSIRAAVDTAERLADDRVKQIIVNVTGGQLQSRHVDVEVTTGGHKIGDGDVGRMIGHASQQHQAVDRELLHCFPLGYTLDGNDGIRDPRGMYGEKLALSVNLISSASGPLRNLANVIGRCHLDVEEWVATPYASGLACLVEEEKKDLGAICIDMGGGSTTVSVFIGGQVVYVDSIPVGGIHVTSDIARGLSTTPIHAERIKTLYGSCLPSPSDDRETIKVPLVGEEDEANAGSVARSLLVQIVQPRLEETFDLVRSRLEESGYDKKAGRQVVLTGGASQMQGVRELATQILNKQVRMGKPMGVSGLAESTSGPAFSACAGLLRHAVENQVEMQTAASNPETSSGTGLFGRFGRWFRENI
jgi:cell division protein FtsA